MTQNRAVVIGGGRWGRIVAGKLAQLDFRVSAATEYPTTSSDITRADIINLDPKPDLIYVASRSEDHARDFERVESLGSRVWVEKNFSRPDTRLFARFLAGDNAIFSQQLFNASLDVHRNGFRDSASCRIVHEIESPVMTPLGLFDWICHDLSLIARMLWLRGLATPSHEVKAALRSEGGDFIAELQASGLTFHLTLKQSRRRARTVSFEDGLTLISGRDGILRLAAGGGEGERTADGDLLGEGLKLALASPRTDVQALTEAVLALHAATHPFVESLPATALRGHRERL